MISSLSDHFPTTCIEECRVQKVAAPYKSRLINDKTIPEFENLLKTAPWDGVIKDDPKVAFDNFFEIIGNARDLAFPEVVITPQNTNRVRSPWMSGGLLKSSKNKNKLFSKYKHKPTLINSEAFKEYNALFNKCRQAAKKAFYAEQFEVHKSNIKKTWTLIRDVIGSRTKKRENLPSFFRENNEILSNPLDISNGFNDFFADK